MYFYFINLPKIIYLKKLFILIHIFNSNKSKIFYKLIKIIFLIPKKYSNHLFLIIQVLLIFFGNLNYFFSGK
jgi:hypothetical protein